MNILLDQPLVSPHSIESILDEIHHAERDLALDEDTYRQLLNTHTGKTSCKTMRLDELQTIIDTMKQKGFKPRLNTAPKKRKPTPSGKLSPKSGSANHPQIDKIRALWIDMYQQGIVRDGSETALDKFVKRMTGVEHVGWLNKQQAQTCIEILKKWNTRIYTNNKTDYKSSTLQPINEKCHKCRLDCLRVCTIY